MTAAIWTPILRCSSDGSCRAHQITCLTRAVNQCSTSLNFLTIRKCDSVKSFIIGKANFMGSMRIAAFRPHKLLVAYQGEHFVSIDLGCSIFDKITIAGNDLQTYRTLRVSEG